MTPLSQTILEQYQVRKTQKQKSALISHMQQVFPNLTVQEGRFPKRKNIIIGDTQSAKVILAADYHTSGAIVLCELLETLNTSLRSKVAFVFLDRKGTDLAKDNLLIYFDRVSDGDHILVAASKAARADYGDTLKASFLPTEHKAILFKNAEKTGYRLGKMGCKQAVAIAAMKRKMPFGYRIGRSRTTENTTIDKANIKLLCDSILNLLKQL